MVSEYSILDNVNDLRRRLVELEEDIKEFETHCKPPIVQEAILARREVEYGRMRLGIILGMLDNA